MELDLSLVDRETALKTWLTYHKLGTGQLAAAIGVNPAFITYLIQGKRRSRRVVEAMVRLGVPRSLLPDAGNGPGRPRL
ncbi:MAG: transcriptional regulator [Desulfovibrionaceae bacterium]